MRSATVTTKGQVTIPKEVRDHLHLHSGDKLTFVTRDDGVVELRPQTVDLCTLAGSLKKEGVSLTLDDMQRAITGESK